MTPQTRSSNKDANFKVYYSKKVAQQAYFPHKRKTVRRRSTPVPDGSEKRQMVFLPEKMKANGANRVEGSDGEEEEEGTEEGIKYGGSATDLTAQEVEEQSPTENSKERGKKRDRDTMQGQEAKKDGSGRPTSKRTRKDAVPKQKRRSRHVEVESEADHDATPPKTENGIDRARTLRRQSTMTQLVDGRRPMSDTEEPDFKPVKRSLRLSWSGKGERKKRDKQQRTLTQMIPGMRPIEIMSDEDMEEALSDLEAQESDSQQYGDAVAQRLAQEGLHRAEGDGSDKATVDHQVEKRVQSPVDHGDEEKVPVHSSNVPTLVVQSIENAKGQDDEDNYQPTRFIEAPITRTNRVRPRKAKQNKRPQLTEALPAALKASKPRFNLLSTPEKRRVRVIPSSQSPAESPLSTQVSPLKAHRSPLKERLGNAINAPETPSKRKQVTFEEPPKAINPPPTLRRFQSTIQDSEDEDEDLIEEDVPWSGQRIGANTRSIMPGVEQTKHGKAVGAHTQAMLEQIDQACAHADEAVLGVPTPTRDRDEASPELGEHQEQPRAVQQENVRREQSSHHMTHIGTKQEPLHEIEMLDLTTPDPSQSHKEQPITNHESTRDADELPIPSEELHSTPPPMEPYPQDTFPSTPMVIQDDSSDEEDVVDPTPPSTQRKPPTEPTSTDMQHSADLDCESVQVPRSPSPQHETQQSHSSKAEQQLQSEWLSYSQYVNTRGPQSSSMNVAHDAFSYIATPMPPRPTVQPPQPSNHHLSQATTVDEVTPKKNRTQRTISANVTPHRIASSQPFFTSPNKPPPLFIASSYASPLGAEMEGWSSPLLGMTQGGSLEDFSIPLPPPVEDD